MDGCMYVCMYVCIQYMGWIAAMDKSKAKQSKAKSPAPKRTKKKKTWYRAHISWFSKCFSKMRWKSRYDPISRSRIDFDWLIDWLIDLWKRKFFQTRHKILLFPSCHPDLMMMWCGSPSPRPFSFPGYDEATLPHLTYQPAYLSTVMYSVRRTDSKGKEKEWKGKGQGRS